ncbi:MAG: trypsin-like peptidase domain-containing protein [bacterium]
MSYPQVVRIYSTTQEPDYDCPWQAHIPSSGSGSGVVIGSGVILTGAHVVADATFIQVQKLSDPNKAVAQVKAICHDSDLALIEILDENFTKDMEPAEIGDFPDLRDNVSVVGFPVGGEEISITEGVVSRLEVQKYDHSQRRLLAATVDAAINEGNSGGPVFKHGKVIGIAFQKIEDADNIGEIVPAPVIRHFLEGQAQGRTPQVPGLGIATANLENPLLRQQVGLNGTRSGVLVTAVEYGSSCWGSVFPRDALLEIGGNVIANNRTTRYRGQYRTSFDVVLIDYYVGDTLELKILRDGRVLDVPIELKPLRDLVPRSRYDILPTYFLYGGVVFQPLTRDLLRTWREWWNRAPPEFLNYYYAGLRTETRQEIVVLSQILGHEINVGYEEFFNEAVISVNGEPPRDMRHFVSLMDQARGVVEIGTSRHGTLMFDADAVRETMPRILERYRIPRDRSADLVPLTSNAPA